MAVNLLNLVKGAVGNQVMKQLGGILGENPKSTESAIGAAVPAILGGLMKKASTPNGAGDIFRTLNDHDGSILDNLGGALGDGGHKSLIEKGAGLLSLLFGSKQNSIIGSIAKLAGIGNSSAGSLLGILAPIVMGVLGKQQRSTGLDVGGLTNLLMSQKDHLSSVMPKELTSDLGIGDILGANGVAGKVGEARRAVGAASRDAQSDGSGLLKSLLPILLIAGLAFLGWQFFGPAAKTVDEAANISDVKVPDFSLDDVTVDLNTSFGDLTDSIRGVSDEASARLVLPKLKQATTAFDTLKLGSLPTAAQTSVGGVLGPLLEKVKSALETAYAIPGVRAILEPAIGPLLEKVGVFTG